MKNCNATVTNNNRSKYEESATSTSLKHNIKLLPSLASCTQKQIHFGWLKIYPEKVQRSIKCLLDMDMIGTATEWTKP